MIALDEKMPTSCSVCSLCWNLSAYNCRWHCVPLSKQNKYFLLTDFWDNNIPEWLYERRHEQCPLKEVEQ